MTKIGNKIKAQRTTEFLENGDKVITVEYPNGKIYDNHGNTLYKKIVTIAKDGTKTIKDIGDDSNNFQRGIILNN